MQDFESDDSSLNAKEQEAKFLRPLALQILHGEFDGGRTEKLTSLERLLLTVDDEFCQRAAGYLHCLLNEGK